MKINSVKELRNEANALRRQFEPAFGPETAFEGESRRIPSAGQCAAVAVIVRNRLGGDMVSATVEGQSHWFNRIRVGKAFVDLDITGDQFGRPFVQVGAEGSLYPGTRVRGLHEIRDETVARASILAAKAGFKELCDS